MKKSAIALISVLALSGCQIPGATPASTPTEATPAAQTQTSPAPTNILTTSMGTTFPIIEGWTVQQQGTDYGADTSESSTYAATVPAIISSGAFYFGETNVAQWLKGPNPDEGYVIAHENRPAVITLLKGIYDHGAFTAEDKTAFEPVAGEFMGYSNKYRAAVTYIETTDKKYRGISFYNLSGQEAGVSPVYIVTMYNSEKGSIISGNLGLDTTVKEVVEVNKGLYGNDADFAKMKPAEIDAADKKAHEDFTKLVETSPRSQLSFGAAIDAIDSFMKAAK